MNCILNVVPSVKYHSNFLPVVPIHLDQCKSIDTVNDQ